MPLFFLFCHTRVTVFHDIFVYVKSYPGRESNNLYYEPKGYYLYSERRKTMKDERQRELLRKVATDRLETVLESNADDEEVQAAFKQAMDAIDRDIELSKIEASNSEQLVKQEQAKKEARREIAIRCIEIGAATIVTPIVYYCTNKGFARLICEFEKNDYFGCSAGKSLSKLFRFGK